MKILIIVIIINLLFGVFCVPSIVRTIARTRAEQIIQGKRPATEKLINRCIAVLTWTNNWVTNDEAPDNRRISRLRNKLNEMQNPHG